MKNMVGPTFRSAGAELKLSATTRHQPARSRYLGGELDPSNFTLAVCLILQSSREVLW
jgi:hypothetical protein